MKILHIIYSLNTGGTETMLVDIVNEQIKTEEVTLIIINDDINEDLINNIDKNVRIFCLNRKPKSRSLLPFLKLNWIIWKEKPDAIHAHYISILKILLPQICHNIYVTVHALRFSLEYVERAKCIFAISEAVKEDIIRRGNHQVKVIANGICIDNISQRKASWNEPNIFRIIQVASLREKKGQDILIEAISILKARGINNVVVDFIGTGITENILKELVQKRGLDGNINFLGLRNRTYIYNHLKDYDLMCHPAREEGFGLSVAEGIAARLPVLVSDEGGPYEIIKEGELGYTFKMEDEVDCADKIEYIMKNYVEAKSKTDEAFLHVKKNYSVERMVKEYIEAFKY